MILFYVIGAMIAMAFALGFTPFVKKFAIAVGAMDTPNARKVHTVPMPRLGGLAIYLAFVITVMIMYPLLDLQNYVVAGLLVGSTLIVLVGALDDRFELSPKWKLLGQVLAASIVVSFGIKVDIVMLPFTEQAINLGFWGVPLTIFWIVGVTNAINLIDGLDGLAAGVSAIAIGAMLALAIAMGNVTVAVLCAVLLGSVLGFLYFNFHPAKIFMGDSGALFLGFALATLSVLGFKQATFVSLVVPLLILGVPLSDTFFAIIRRIIHKKPISVADKDHLHHCLQRFGYGHRNTVFIIYAVASCFALSAVLLSQATVWATVLIIAALLIAIELGAEAIGIFHKNFKPLLGLFRRMTDKGTS